MEVLSKVPSNTAKIASHFSSSQKIGGSLQGISPKTDPWNSQSPFIRTLNRAIEPKSHAKFIMLKEKFLLAFLQDFPTIGHLRCNMCELGVSRAYAACPNKPLHWFNALRSLCKLALNERDKNNHLRDGKYYEESLPMALELTGWFKDEQAIRAFISRLRTAMHHKHYPEREAALTEKFKAAFKAKFPQRKYLRPADFNCTRVRNAAVGNPAHWMHPLRSLCRYLCDNRDANNRLRDGNWYGETLPLALRLSGYFNSGDDISLFVSSAHRAAELDGVVKRRAKRHCLRREEIFAAFSAESVSFENMLANPLYWTKISVRARAHSMRGHWFHAARVAFQKETKLTNEPYLGEFGMLAWLVRNSSILHGHPNAEAQISSLLAAIHDAQYAVSSERLAQLSRSRNPRKYVSAVLRNRYTKEEVFDNPSLVSEKAISSVRFGRTPYINFVRKAYGSNDWLGVLLPNLLEDAYHLDGEAPALIERVRNL